MKTLLLSLSILFLGLCLVAFRETRATEDRAGVAQVNSSAADSSLLSTPAPVALKEQESLLQRLPWFAMFCAWLCGNVLVLAGLWAAWRFFGRGSGTSAGLSLA
ncbi:MAG: hypothetical protein EXS08_02590 [Planctomycetes bacterium]|nr:hypothetical protein [Planctomycetota bacterium]